MVEGTNSEEIGNLKANAGIFDVFVFSVAFDAR